MTAWAELSRYGGVSGRGGGDSLLHSPLVLDKSRKSGPGSVANAGVKP